MKYRADIDGLRSIAVIPVVLFHLGFDWVSGGYFGVDVFFVISGFLITSILSRSIESGSFSMKDFWIRRVKRIAPAIITVVLVTLLVAPLLIFKGDIDTLVSDSTAALFSYANFHLLAKVGDYWGASAEKSFFLHAWSLSIEEQFYIFYPFFLILLYRFKQSIVKWLAAGTFLSLGAYLLGSGYYPSHTFYLLPTRAWELACGGLLAVINIDVFSQNKQVNFFSSTLGLALIFSSYFVFNGREGFNFHTILPVVGAMLIIVYSSEQHFIGQFLSLKPMVFIGKISYSLYLWHWPVIVLLNSYYYHLLSPWQIQMIAIITMIILSVASFYLVENKTRRWEHTPKLVLMLIGITICLSSFLRSNHFDKTYTSSFDQTAFYGLFYDITPEIWTVSEVNKAKRDGIFAPKRDSKFDESYKSGGIVTSALEGYPSIVVWGDSHGAMWAKTVDEIAEANNVKVSFYTSVGVTPFINLSNIENQKSVKGFTDVQRVSYAKDFTANLQQWKPRLLVVVCKWSNKTKEELEELVSIINFVEQFNTNVLILNQPPLIDAIGEKNSAQYLSFLGYKPSDGLQYIQSSSEIEDVNKSLKKNFSAYSNVYFFDTFSYFIEGNITSTSIVINERSILYYDDDHLSYQGTLFLKPELDDLISSLISTSK